MNNGRRLQGVLAALAPHLARGDPVQLAVYQRHELVRCFYVAGAPLLEKAGDCVCILGHLRLVRT